MRSRPASAARSWPLRPSTSHRRQWCLPGQRSRRSSSVRRSPGGCLQRERAPSLLCRRFGKGTCHRPASCGSCPRPGAATPSKSASRMSSSRSHQRAALLRQCATSRRPAETHRPRWRFSVPRRRWFIKTSGFIRLFANDLSRRAAKRRPPRRVERPFDAWRRRLFATARTRVFRPDALGRMVLSLARRRRCTW